jgi:hypothetical protein
MPEIPPELRAVLEKMGLPMPDEADEDLPKGDTLTCINVVNYLRAVACAEVAETALLCGKIEPDCRESQEGQLRPEGFDHNTLVLMKRAGKLDPEGDLGRQLATWDGVDHAREELRRVRERCARRVAQVVKRAEDRGEVPNTQADIRGLCEGTEAKQLS